VHFPQSIEDQLVAGFPEPTRSTAREALPHANQLSVSAPYERVVLAILKLASGDIEKLTHFADVARKDWRDVLYWTERPVGSAEPKNWEELKSRLGLPDT
jgi:hypothetical protein